MGLLPVGNPFSPRRTGIPNNRQTLVLHKSAAPYFGLAERLGCPLDGGGWGNVIRMTWMSSKKAKSISPSRNMRGLPAHPLLQCHATHACSLCRDKRPNLPQFVASSSGSSSSDLVPLQCDRQNGCDFVSVCHNCGVGWRGGGRGEGGGAFNGACAKSTTRPTLIKGSSATPTPPRAAWAGSHPPQSRTAVGERHRECPSYRAYEDGRPPAEPSRRGTRLQRQ